MPSKFEDNTFYLSEFDDQMEHEIGLPLILEIEKQAKFKDGAVNLWISSIGGFGYLCDHIIELIEHAKKRGVIVRTMVPAMAFSAGSMVAVAGTPGERYIGSKAEHLVHYGSLMSFESTPQQVERYTEHKKRQFRISLDHYKKYCDIPNLDAEMLDDGYFVPAAKAIKFGLADKYLTKLPNLADPAA